MTILLGIKHGMATLRFRTHSGVVLWTMKSTVRFSEKEM